MACNWKLATAAIPGMPLRDKQRMEIMNRIKGGKNLARLYDSRWPFVRPIHRGSLLERSTQPAQAAGLRAPLVCLLGLAAAILACSRTNAVTYTPLAESATREATQTSIAPPATDAPTMMLATPTLTPTLTPSPTFPPTPTRKRILTPESKPYTIQAGDTVRAVAIRFGVQLSDIHPVEDATLPTEGLLEPGHTLMIPMALDETTKSDHLFPDSAVVNSSSSAHFDVNKFALAKGGYLGTTAAIPGDGRTGSEALRQMALNNSFSPKLLMALIENASGWVTHAKPDAGTLDFPLGGAQGGKGLHSQLIWGTNLLSIGYYGWRDATLLELTFGNGSTVRLAPDLNAGTVAVMYFFSKVAPSRAEWERDLQKFMGVYKNLQGDPYDNSQDPLYYPALHQPDLDLPFIAGQKWAFTGGPHGAWELDGARAALDFAPPSSQSGCAVSELWATAVAPGIVIRSRDGVVVLDLDGDGLEQTGWNILYLHMSAQGRVAEGAHVATGDPIGHPSCEGGIATGAHLHLARKYNGEWMAAGGPVPFNLNGWIASAGEKPYEGTLARGGDIAVAKPSGSFDTLVWH
jgi:LasA protease